jgi:CheY-like chemotaxis protein
MSRILLVDDDPMVRDTLSRILQRAGHEVTTAQNGREGLKLYAEIAPEIVITDILMPDKEGIETITTLRKHSRTVPIIAISGGGRISNADLLDYATTFGATRTLHKPILPEDLLRTVKEVAPGSNTAAGGR